MIGLDTNVLVRYIMQDDPVQEALATCLLESLTADAPGYVPVVALVELYWVLSSCYDLDRPQLIEAVEGLLHTQVIVVENAEVVWKAVRTYRMGSADFPDCLIASVAATVGCLQTMTFDRKAVKHAGMTLIE